MAALTLGCIFIEIRKASENKVVSYAQKVSKRCDAFVIFKVVIVPITAAYQHGKLTASKRAKFTKNINKHGKYQHHGEMQGKVMNSIGFDSNGWSSRMNTRGMDFTK